MYSKVSTKDLMEEIQDILKKKYRIHVSNGELRNILNYHFSIVANVMREQSGIFWMRRFRIIPDEQNIMRRLLMKKNARLNNIKRIKEKYYDSDEQKTTRPF